MAPAAPGVRRAAEAALQALCDFYTHAEPVPAKALVALRAEFHEAHAETSRPFRVDLLRSVRSWSAAAEHGDVLRISRRRQGTAPP